MRNTFVSNMKRFARSFLVFFLFVGMSKETYSRIINVKLYGARGDGKTDNTSKVQAALDACRKNERDTLYFPRGQYLFRSFVRPNHYFENYFLKIHSNLTILGQDSNTCLKIADHLFDKADSMANAHLFYGRQVKGFSIQRICIDLNGSQNLVPAGFIKNHSALFIDEGEDVILISVRISNSAGRNMIILKGTGSIAKIENCRFINGGRYVGKNVNNRWQDDFSFVYSEWDHTQMLNNIIRQENASIALTGYTGGIELHGSYSLASGNEIYGCYPAIYISSSWHPMYGTQILNNRLLDCVKGISFWVHYPLSDIVIRNNRISLVTATSENNPPVISGIEIPNGNASQYGFKQANNAPLYRLQIIDNEVIARSSRDKVKTAGMLLHSLQEARISGNLISGVNYAGLIIQGSKWGTDSVLITGNRFEHFRENPDAAAVGGYVVITDSYANKQPEALGIRKIYVSDNSEELKTSDRLPKNFFLFFAAIPRKFMQEMHISDRDQNQSGIRVVSTD